MNKTERDREIIALAWQGLSYQHIGALCGVSGACVSNIVANCGEAESIRQQRQADKARRAEERRQEQRAIVEDAVSRGLTSAQLAEEHKHTPIYWEKVARENGCRILKPNGQPMRDGKAERLAKKTAICAYLREGHTQQEASEKFGILRVEVSRIALESGMRRRLTGEALLERNRQIVSDIESGMTQREAAEKYGMSLNNVGLIYAGRNIEIRQHDDLDARNRAILDDFDAGMSRIEIAERNHVSLHVVGQVVVGRQRGKGASC